MFWRDGQTWGQIPVVECHWDWLSFCRRDSTNITLSLPGIIEVLSLCCTWEILGSNSNSLSQPISAHPCTDQGIRPTLWWCCKEGVWLVCCSSEAFEVMRGYGQAWELVAAVLCLTGCLLQSGTQVQISPKAECVKLQISGVLHCGDCGQQWKGGWWLWVGSFSNMAETGEIEKQGYC